MSPSFGLDKLSRIEAKMDEAYTEFKKKVMKDLIDEM